jgi:hypothetical protein
MSLKKWLFHSNEEFECHVLWEIATLMVLVPE